ncbi:MAG: hypothetical protein PHG27_12975 [Massilibacteroides sp.]|nr:hypothetical protein [Massilibacteroides sp.]MDD4661141.1 hypothetical protein [Massilibacteroides sp.]
MQKAGYVSVVTFILPGNYWIEHYAAPQVKVQQENARRIKITDTSSAYKNDSLKKTVYLSIGLLPFQLCINKINSIF